MTIEEIELWVSIEQILTPQEFYIFELRHKYKHTQEQIGEILRCSQPTISNALENIYYKLQGELK